jgi:hypothetical protein
MDVSSDVKRDSENKKEKENGERREEGTASVDPREKRRSSSFFLLRNTGEKHNSRKLFLLPPLVTPPIPTLESCISRSPPAHALLHRPASR